MADIHDILKQYWGYVGFRPSQEDIITSLLHKNDTLAILPTGGGKSICFQVPALVQHGVCLVVSPLIALIKDQVQALKQKNIGAASLISGMSAYEIDNVFQDAIHQRIKFLYVSPERLSSETTKNRLRDIQLNAIAIDEAHCISQWGYDFRPSYLKLSELRTYFPDIPIIALTASATPKVKEDIIAKLQLQRPKIFQQSVARKNIQYFAIKADNKIDKLLFALKKTKGSCLVYARNRRQTQEIAQFLCSHGLKADHYHAGLSVSERTKKQELWINNQIQTIVCTNAFGMGIDKPDVRLVAHIDLPDSLEAYYQEAGRAGRDGKESYALLFHNQQDILKLQENIEWAFPSKEVLEEVYEKLNNYFQIKLHSGEGRSFDFEIQHFSEVFKVHSLTVYNALKIYEYNGLIKLTEAVFLPSTVRVKVSHQQFLEQNTHEELLQIMQVLVRMYSGLYSYPARIQEKQIGHKLNIPTQRVIDGLHKMHKMHWVEYNPVNDKPVLTFMQHRVDQVLKHINLAFLKTRKEDAQLKVTAMIDLVQKNKCRSLQIQHYFGEQAKTRCLTCDACASWLKQSIEHKDLIKIFQRLKLLSKPISQAEMNTYFKGFSQIQQQKALTLLQEEGLITFKDANWSLL